MPELLIAIRLRRCGRRRPRRGGETPPFAGADAYERELLDAFDAGPKRLGRYVDAETEEVAV